MVIVCLQCDGIHCFSKWYILIRANPLCSHNTSRDYHRFVSVRIFRIYIQNHNKSTTKKSNTTAQRNQNAVKLKCKPTDANNKEWIKQQQKSVGRKEKIHRDRLWFCQLININFEFASAIIAIDFDYELYIQFIDRIASHRIPFHPNHCLFV